MGKHPVEREKPRQRSQQTRSTGQGIVKNNPEPWMASGYFGESTISPNLGRSLHEMKYAQPTSIQEVIIPLVRAGRDIVGQAQTGTGKTAAFGIPLVEALDPKSRKPQVLVLTPTRELALQVNGELNLLGKYSGIRSLAVYGGQSMETQVIALNKGVHIMVATPGRLMDHMRRGTVHLGALRTVVLDEADQMLDIGFADDIEHILRQTPRTRQTLLLSATMPTTIKRLVYRYLDEPKWVRIGGDAEPVEKVTLITKTAMRSSIPVRSSSAQIANATRTLSLHGGCLRNSGRNVVLLRLQKSWSATWTPATDIRWPGCIASRQCFRLDWPASRPT